MTSGVPDLLALERQVSSATSVYGETAPQTIEAVQALLSAQVQTAKLYFEQGNEDLSEHLTSLLDRGIALGEKYKHLHHAAVALNGLYFYRGLHRKRTGDANGAVADLLRSLQSDDESGAPPHAVLAHFHIAPLLAAQSVHAAAFEHAYLAVFLLERVVKPFLSQPPSALNAAQLEHIRLLSEALRNLAHEHEYFGQTPQAARALEQSAQLTRTFFGGGLTASGTGTAAAARGTAPHESALRMADLAPAPGGGRSLATSSTAPGAGGGGAGAVSAAAAAAAGSAAVSGAGAASGHGPRGTAPPLPAAQRADSMAISSLLQPASPPQLPSHAGPSSSSLTLSRAAAATAAAAGGSAGPGAGSSAAPAIAAPAAARALAEAEERHARELQALREEMNARLAATSHELVRLRAEAAQRAALQTELEHVTRERDNARRELSQLQAAWQQSQDRIAVVENEVQSAHRLLRAESARVAALENDLRAARAQAADAAAAESSARQQAQTSVAEAAVLRARVNDLQTALHSATAQNAALARDVTVLREEMAQAAAVSRAQQLETRAREEHLRGKLARLQGEILRAADASQLLSSLVPAVYTQPTAAGSGTTAAATPSQPRAQSPAPSMSAAARAAVASLSPAGDETLDEASFSRMFGASSRR